ncbi:MAG TPA: hypothetical protein PKJ41_14280 [Bryobacteraceae bacterium]|nr:hypothetical protein [Bryobacteraceae bacterium]HPT25915.1 hypothetical protein [Bryobacteraceae bacterium]
MTKVEIEYMLESPVSEQTLLAIANAPATYGLRKVTLAPSMDRLTVTFDASRLTVIDVERVLHACGIAVTRRP